MNKFTIYIVDDDSRILEALEWLLQSVEFIVKKFSNGIQFLEIIEHLQQGCVLLDVRMPYISGMKILEILYEKKIQTPTIMISGHGDIPMAVQSLKLGAYDFITKPFNEQQLLEKIQNALISRPTVKRPYEEIEKINQLYSSLTGRERQIYSLILSGEQNKQIALIVGIALSTVEMHRANIMKKMQASNLAQLIKKGLLLDV